MKSQNDMHAEVKKIADELKDIPGSLIMILHELQDYYGYVPRAAALELSRVIDVPLARIYEVLTFYNFFKLEAPGKHLISVCMGTACYLKGASNLLSEIKNILNVEEGKTTKDGVFQLEVVRCLGCCGLSPVMKIDDKIYGKVTKNQVMEILSHYTAEKKEG